MDAVQRMRLKAQQAGKLSSTPQQTVTTTNDNGQLVIAIQSRVDGQLMSVRIGIIKGRSPEVGRIVIGQVHHLRIGGLSLWLGV